jgi:hypothetical protein
MSHHSSRGTPEGDEADGRAREQGLCETRGQASGAEQADLVVEGATLVTESAVVSQHPSRYRTAADSICRSEAHVEDHAFAGETQILCLDEAGPSDGGTASGQDIDYTPHSLREHWSASASQWPTGAAPWLSHGMQAQTKVAGVKSDSVLGDAPQPASFADLPNEVVLQILGYLEVCDLLPASRVGGLVSFWRSRVCGLLLTCAGLPSFPPSRTGPHPAHHPPAPDACRPSPAPVVAAPSLARRADCPVHLHDPHHRRVEEAFAIARQHSTVAKACCAAVTRKPRGARCAPSRVHSRAKRWRQASARSGGKEACNRA